MPHIQRASAGNEEEGGGPFPNMTSTDGCTPKDTLDAPLEPCELRIIQINTNRMTVAMDMAVGLAAERGASILAVSEPNVKAARGKKWINDRRCDASIGLLGNTMKVNDTGAGNGFVWIRIRGYVVYSVYISPNCGIDNYKEVLFELGESIRQKRDAKLIIAGDFNAKSPMWGSIREDNRGRLLGNLFSSMNLVPLNDGVYTFVRGESGSVIDVTAVSESIATRVRDWRVLADEESFGPHRFIIYTIGRPKPIKDRWIFGPINTERLKEALTSAMSPDLEATPEKLVHTIHTAYTNTTPRGEPRMAEYRIGGHKRLRG